MINKTGSGEKRGQAPTQLTQSETGQRKMSQEKWGSGPNTVDTNPSELKIQ